MNTLLKTIKGLEWHESNLGMHESKLLTTPRVAVNEYREGRDEMNLVEFPLSSIADRFLDDVDDGHGPTEACSQT